MQKDKELDLNLEKSFVKDIIMKLINRETQNLGISRKFNIVMLIMMGSLTFVFTEVQAARTYDTKLFIDCNHAKVSREWTKSLIKIRFLSKTGKNLGTYFLDSTETSKSSCTSVNPLKYNNQSLSGRPLDQYWRKVIHVKLDGYATNVIIETEGGDGFLIDALALGVDGNSNKYWGQDDAGAWCLSTDKKDANKSWKKYVGKNSCYTAIHFKAKSGKYKYSYHSLLR